jgi:hypothetical protein
LPPEGGPPVSSRNHMRQHRRLLALLLVAVYTAVSSFGVAFVVCTEFDGSQNVEPVGAACCESVNQLSAAASGDEGPSSTASATSEACGDCQDRVTSFDVEARKFEEAQDDASSPVVLPPPAALVSVTAKPHARLDLCVFRARARPPRSSPAIGCLRSVILRC